MTKIIIQYESDDFRGLMFERLHKVLDILPNCKITIDFMVDG